MATTSSGPSITSCRATQESGLIAADNSHGPMYGHGFATLFLGEVYGMTGDDDVKEKLQKAVRLIQNTQNKEGGWRYQPVPYDADISVTITEIMALRAARDAGIKVEKEVVDKAIGYVRTMPVRRRRVLLRRGPGHPARASHARPPASPASTMAASSRATTSSAG